MAKIERITFEKISRYFENLDFVDLFFDENSKSFEFIKNCNDVKYFVRITYFLDKGKISLNTRIPYYIFSNKVNCILEKFTYTKGVYEDTLLAFPNYNKNIDDKTLNQLKNLYIQTEEDFQLALGIIATHIETYVLPFFAKVPNLQTINDEVINKVPQQDYTKYIKGSTTYKVLIIMKLCHNTKFDEFKNWALDAYEKEIPKNPEKWTKALMDLKSLIMYLESGQYQECLTPKE
ncbi:hypothetical protein SAMN05444372_108102 [Flavobacterium micromati]|uniref:Uncharacterized protein n=1 Tax=Flavobacterium micromati TaxID=229205 RepID=A0A1M5LJN7_9FLAO|nr:hypothetical protein [Flavobacterium micromati]SHG65332.1 hypothetical protein SAMN05444372_108102 [Flavobacterium micromati]